MEPVFTDSLDGRIDIDDFTEKVQDCKAVIINSPSNPTGRVEAIDTLKKIEAITSELGVYVLSDEVYKDLMYVRENYLIKGPHVVTINSFSKTFAMCGFRVGYLWSLDQDLVREAIDIKTHTSMNTNILGQEMALAATGVPTSFIEEQLEVWRATARPDLSGTARLGTRPVEARRGLLRHAQGGKSNGLCLGSLQTLQRDHLFGRVVWRSRSRAAVLCARRGKN